jgi:putative tryptophan/tyrosine transport system substrate-binding protein
MVDMRRRDFITLIGGAVASSPLWPLSAGGEHAAMPVIGFLYPGVPELSAGIVAAFRKGLGETGFAEGRNVAVEFRFAYNDNARLSELAADLVRRRVAVIATPGSTPSALAAKGATTAIPIVFSIGTDPVEVGLVASFNRPGGNVTGISSLNSELAAKRLGLLHELLPNAVCFAVLVNPNNPNADTLARDAKAAGLVIGREIEILASGTTRDIDAAFASSVQKRADALLVSPDPLLDNRRVQIITLATHHRLPTIYSFRESVEIGGLMSYGSSAEDRDRLVGIYTGRILKGEKPAELPVMRATKFEFVVNLQTARVLGLDIPATLLARADEVIE